MYKLSQRSLKNLSEVHKDLQDIVHEAIKETDYDFTVIEGRRSIETQIGYVERKVSTTFNSRHLHGLAVDLLPYNEAGVDCFNPKCHNANEVFAAVARTMKRVADKQLGEFSIEWGGDWSSFLDLPHFQLPHNVYADDPAVTDKLKSRGLI